MDAIPDELFEQISNVVVMVEDEPPPGDDLLGEYIGVPLTERYDYSGALPDVIKIYMGPICRLASTNQEVVEEVYATVVHEVAHHFGIDDDTLDQMGWG